MSKLPIALQIYTVRDQSTQDFAGTMRQVADIGSDGLRNELSAPRDDVRRHPETLLSGLFGSRSTAQHQRRQHDSENR